MMQLKKINEVLFVVVCSFAGCIHSITFQNSSITFYYFYYQLKVVGTHGLSRFYELIFHSFELSSGDTQTLCVPFASFSEPFLLNIHWVLCQQCFFFFASLSSSCIHLPELCTYSYFTCPLFSFSFSVSLSIFLNTKSIYLLANTHSKQLIIFQFSIDEMCKVTKGKISKPFCG